MKPLFPKALNVQLSNQIDSVDALGNYSTYKLITDKGTPKLLRFVIRSGNDIKATRIQAYSVLVP